MKNVFWLVFLIIFHHTTRQSLSSCFVAALSRIDPYIVDPLTVETVAVWHAAQFVCEMGYQKVVLEGNSLSVISALQRVGPCGSGCGQLISDTQIILSSLEHHSFKHVKRDANKAAHGIGKFALSQLLDKVWVDGCSPIIQHIVLAEQAEDYWSMKFLFFQKKKKKKKKKKKRKKN
jgi:hypothetical protein